MLSSPADRIAGIGVPGVISIPTPHDRAPPRAKSLILPILTTARILALSVVAGREPDRLVADRWMLTCGHFVGA